jgi:protocatechuate 3,4-dioxygenase beta subunit
VWKNFSIAAACAVLLLALGYVFVGSFRVWLNHTVYETTYPEVVGGLCGPNCEAANEYPRDTELKNTATLPDFHSDPKDRIVLSGKILRADGAPTADVILYVYQANTSGIYPQGGSGRVAAVPTHGYLRGWVRTDASGEYRFYTNKPAPYPNATLPAHVHAVVKEPGKNEYAIDDFWFPGDPFLTEQSAASQFQRGGSGLTTLQGTGPDGLPVYRRDIHLGRNIPNYPK